MPFTSGKFIATCLMMSPNVYPMLTPEEIFYRIENKSTLKWNEVEYSDIDFWWNTENKDWFNTRGWQDYLASGPIESVAKDQYVFYTVHEPSTLQFIHNYVCKHRPLVIIPDADLCRSNYNSKNLIPEEADFDISRVKRDLDNFVMLDTDLYFYQQHIYDETQFSQGMQMLVDNLKINLDINLVLKYRDLYLKNPFNEHINKRM